MLAKPVTPEAVVRPPLTRQKSRRFSFTRSVSREIYKRSQSKSNLHDGATPILIPDDETDSPNNEEEDCSSDVEFPMTNGNAEDDEVFTKDFNDFSITDSKVTTKELVL
ncbi:hypothetical protein QE152_g39554 [Popillia japonica]|uniref:Uncharacterized protein n=1 Tax=Popillia japonica TaxID=7064 RepID=A0AAW1HTQ9_POPJA